MISFCFHLPHLVFNLVGFVLFCLYFSLVLLGFVGVVFLIVLWYFFFALSHPYFFHWHILSHHFFFPVVFALMMFISYVWLFIGVVAFVGCFFFPTSAFLDSLLLYLFLWFFNLWLSYSSLLLSYCIIILSFFQVGLFRHLHWIG